MKSFEVRAKCGHVGRNYYVEKSFIIKAKDKREAAAIVRDKPRVKHHAKDAIRWVAEIDDKTYLEKKKEYDSDPYFKCKSIQEQKINCELTILEEIVKPQYKKKDKSNQKFYYGKEKIRNPKKYFNRYLAIA